MVIIVKRICFIWGVLIGLIFPNLVFANGLQVDVTNDDGTNKLEYIDFDKRISFKEAKEKYNVNDYFSILVDNEVLYFYQGKEISEEKYNVGVDSNSADERVKMYGEYGIRVHSTEDIIKTIDNLYAKRFDGEYHLVYSRAEYESINFDQINEYVSEHYLINKNTNIFKYSEYGIFNYPRFPYDYNEYDMIVSVSPIISLDEEEKLNIFMDTFKDEFSNKTDYEKVLIAYTYLTKTVSKPNEEEPNTSAYNALIDRNAGCIGEANAFSYIMDHLGIESYIANNSIFKEDSVVSTHTFNIVKLNGLYYIVDLTVDGYNGLLTTNDSNIIFSNGIEISKDPYVKDSFNVSINYGKYDKLVDNIKREVQQKESLDNKKEDLKSVDFTSYLILIIILLVLTIIIIIFTRKK